MINNIYISKKYFLRIAVGIAALAILMIAGDTIINVLANANNTNTDPVNQIDFDVTYIERTPRYNYDAGKNNPISGDPVTFTGHIRNWGNFTGTVDYRWYLDGMPITDGVLNDLLPDEERIVNLSWTWSTGNHRIRLIVDPANNINESSEKNNAIEDRTDAISIGFWVEQSVYDYFHEHQQELGIGSNSWEDWAQRQTQQWNLHNKRAVYPSSPQGVIDRVRLDKIIVVQDGSLPLAEGVPTNHPDLRDKTIDMMWGFPANLLNGSFYIDHTSLMINNAFYLEPSLIHELGHARYLIDNYGFDVHYTAENPQVQIYENGELVAGSQLMPFIEWNSALYYNQLGGIMTGPWDEWSPYEACALNLIAGLRASQGNYNAPSNIGIFLQDLPENNHVLFMDTSGQPLAGANVRVYRAGPGPGWYGKLIDNTFDMEFTTNSSGYANMPRNPFADGKIVNTYGLSNGVVVLRIAHQGNLWYRFMEVTGFNMEYWKGNTTHAYYVLEFPETGSSADIEILGYGNEIINGDATPSPTDHTDFGQVRIHGGSVTHQFIIKNHGAQDLHPSIEIQGPDASDFDITNGPFEWIEPEMITTFQVKFYPQGAGLHQASVIVTSDDPNKSRYEFTIAGIGISDMTAMDDIFIVRADQQLEIGPPGILINDILPVDIHIDAMRIDGPSNGSLQFRTDGSFVYTPDAGFHGNDSFQYKLNDGEVESNLADVTLNVANTFINGTVIDNATQIPLVGARVYINSHIFTLTDASGFYSLNVPEGEYNLTAELEPIYYATTMVLTVGTQVVEQDIELIKKPTGNISGSVSELLTKVTGNISGMVKKTGNL